MKKHGWLILAGAAGLLVAAIAFRSGPSASGRKAGAKPEPPAQASVTFGRAPIEETQPADARIRYAQLPPEEMREAVFGVVDDVRFAREKRDGSALAQAMLDLRAMGASAIPHLLEDLELAKTEDLRMAALYALQAFGTPADPAAVIRILEQLPESSDSRLLGAFLLLDAPDASGYLASVRGQAQSRMGDARLTPEIRSMSIQIYGRVAGAGAEPELLELASSSQPFPVKYAALGAMAKNGVSSYAKDALRRVDWSKQSPMVRAIATSILRSRP